MIKSKVSLGMRSTFLTLFSILLTVSACGSENFKASPNRVKDQEKLRAEQSNAAGAETPASTPQNQAVTATLGEGSQNPASSATSSAGTENADDVSVGSALGDSAQGWNEIRCGGNLFTGVFAHELAGGMNLLGGWQAPTGSNQNTPSNAGVKGSANLLEKLDECVDADLKALKAQGLQYVLVTFDPSTKVVLSAKPFNGPGVNQADYNQCAREAGALAAGQSVASIAELLKNSRLAGEATCGSGACCIDIK